MRHEGVEAGVERLRAYVDAGADIAMAFCRDGDLRMVAEAVDAPMSTITGLDHHTPAEWADMGWNLIIDAFTAQALAINSTRDAYERFLSTGSTGTEIDGMGLHRELVDLCGLNPLLEIERNTTEPGARS
jgi:2-methylisocitrate lyase-like PEP mutase family enzyme